MKPKIVLSSLKYASCLILFISLYTFITVIMGKLLQKIGILHSKLINIFVNSIFVTFLSVTVTNNTVHYVPLTSTIFRTICRRCLLKQFFQQFCASFLKHELKANSYLNVFTLSHVKFSVMEPTEQPQFNNK